MSPPTRVWIWLCWLARCVRQTFPEPWRRRLCILLCLSLKRVGKVEGQTCRLEQSQTRTCVTWHQRLNPPPAFKGHPAAHARMTGSPGAEPCWTVTVVSVSCFLLPRPRHTRSCAHWQFLSDRVRCTAVMCAVTCADACTGGSLDRS